MHLSGPDEKGADVVEAILGEGRLSGPFPSLSDGETHRFHDIATNFPLYIRSFTSRGRNGGEKQMCAPRNPTGHHVSAQRYTMYHVDLPIHHVELLPALQYVTPW